MEENFNPISYSLKWCYDQSIPNYHLKHLNYTEIAYLCWYIRAGQLDLKFGSEQINARAGTWIWMDPLTPRSHAFSPGSHIVSIRFIASWQGLNYVPPLTALQVINAADYPELLGTAEELSHSPRTLSGDPVELCLKQTRFYSWLHQWHQTRKAVLGTASTSQQQLDPRAVQIMTWLNNSRNSRVIAYKELSHAVGLSKAQIDRIFLRETGVTIHQWIDNNCRRLAEQSLANPSLSIKEIAAMLHFTTASHFSKWFAAHNGLTPRDWRKWQTPLSSLRVE